MYLKRKAKELLRCNAAIINQEQIRKYIYNLLLFYSSKFSNRKNMRNYIKKNILDDISYIKYHTR